jgi:hypothetical protein
VVVSTEYKVVRLSPQAEPATWEQQLNEAAVEGFEWVQGLAGADGDTYVVMRRLPSGRGRIVPL